MIYLKMNEWNDQNKEYIFIPIGNIKIIYYSC